MSVLVVIVAICRSQSGLYRAVECQGPFVAGAAWATRSGILAYIGPSR
jgi:hypothetical protein